MDYMTDAPFVPAQLHFSVTLKRESEKINSFVLCFPEWSSPSLNQKQLLVHSGKPSKPVLEFLGWVLKVCLLKHIGKLRSTSVACLPLFHIYIDLGLLPFKVTGSAFWIHFLSEYKWTTFRSRRKLTSQCDCEVP